MKKEQKQSFLFICHGKDCMKRGAKEVHQGLEQEIKKISCKICPKIVKTKCLDHCKDGPCMVVNGVWYGRVGIKDLRKFMNKKAAT